MKKYFFDAQRAYQELNFDFKYVPELDLVSGKPSSSVDDLEFDIEINAIINSGDAGDFVTQEYNPFLFQGEAKTTKKNETTATLKSNAIKSKLLRLISFAK